MRYKHKKLEQDGESRGKAIGLIGEKPFHSAADLIESEMERKNKHAMSVISDVRNGGPLTHESAEMIMWRLENEKFLRLLGLW
jgi:hypothetical protein